MGGWKSFSEALGGRKKPRAKGLCSVGQGFLFLVLLAYLQSGCSRHSRKEQGWKTPCPFYLEAFGSFKSLFHPLEHPHVSRHSQHLSLPSQPEAQSVSRRPGAEREAPKKRSPALIYGLIPTKRLWSRAQPCARESCQREGKEGEREEARAVPAGAD